MVTTLDKIINEPINKQFVYYLMSCYLYYERDLNILSDYDFDTLCKSLLDNYDSISHRHKNLITREDLSASTGYMIKYPRILKDASMMWYNDYIEHINPKRKKESKMNSIVDRYLKIKNKDSSFIGIDISLPYKRRLKGITEGIEILGRHMKAKNKILLYCDYDCDGVTSALVLNRAMELLDYKDFCTVEINKRDLGNGINDSIVTYIQNNPEIKLVITADHGTSNEHHIGLIRALGVDVIITDHHQLRADGAPKSASCFINPQQEEDSLYKSLSGCAVAYLFMYNFLKECGVVFDEYEMLDLVAISTIGDMMDLSDPVNRALTLTGMRHLQNTALGRGFKRLLSLEHIDSKDISFKIVPMINSCSRVAEPSIAFVSLYPATDSIMDDNLEYLVTINNKRKAIQKSLVATANKQLKANRKTNVLVVPKSGTGINGIVASNLSNATKRPTIIFIHGDEHCTGSCRGFIPTLDVKACFDKIHKEHPGIFVVTNGEVKYGGHSGAAGCAVYTNKLEEFNELFEAYVKDLNFNVRDMIRAQKDNAIDISNLRNLKEELNGIKKLAPFGNGWENPLLLVRPETIKNVRKIMIPGDTIIVKFTVRLDGDDYNFTHFHNSNLDLELKGSDILCTANVGRSISFDVKELI